MITCTQRSIGSGSGTVTVSGTGNSFTGSGIGSDSGTVTVTGSGNSFTGDSIGRNTSGTVTVSGTGNSFTGSGIGQNSGTVTVTGSGNSFTGDSIGRNTSGTVTVSGTGNSFTGSGIGRNTGTVTVTGSGNSFTGNGIGYNGGTVTVSGGGNSFTGSAIGSNNGKLTVSANGVHVGGYLQANGDGIDFNIKTSGQTVLGKRADLAINELHEATSPSSGETETDRGSWEYAVIVGCGEENQGLSNGGGSTGVTPYQGDTANCLALHYNGNMFIAGKLEQGGGDYAEYIREWSDGNPDGEDRVGLFVTVKQGKLEIAQPDDYIVGVISGAPGIVGGGEAEEHWRGRYERDVFGRKVKIVKTVADYDGDMNVTGYHTYLDEKTSDEYDCRKAKTYRPRQDRNEWDTVGMLGILPVRDDGTCEPDGWCKCGEGGTATKCERKDADDTFFVLSRKQEKEGNDYGVIEIIMR